MRLFTGDWIVGTIGLTFEQKGFYLEVLLRMWERKAGLPNDDKWLAAALQCNPRTVRKLKAELIALGKLVVECGKLVNPRMMREIGSGRIGAELEPNSTRIGAELEPNAPKNPTITTHAQARALHFHIQKEEEKKERVVPTDAPHPEPARASEDPPDFVECKSAFNGSTERMLAEIETAMGSSGDRDRAAQWLASLLRTNDQHSVSQSFQMFLNAKAEGQVITHLLRYWSKTASSLKAMPQTAHARIEPKGNGSRTMEILNRRSAEART